MAYKHLHFIAVAAKEIQRPWLHQRRHQRVSNWNARDFKILRMITDEYSILDRLLHNIQRGDIFSFKNSIFKAILLTITGY